MIRTNIVLDNGVLGKAKHLTGFKTTRAVVHYALKELVRHKRQKDLLTLKGKVIWEGNLATSRIGRNA